MRPVEVENSDPVEPDSGAERCPWCIQTGAFLRAFGAFRGHFSNTHWVESSLEMRVRPAGRERCIRPGVSNRVAH